MRRLLLFLGCFLALVAPVWAQAPAGPVGHATTVEKNPFSSPQDVEMGNKLFQTHCSYCHGAFGEGGRGADLTTGQFRHGDTDGEIFNNVRNGIPGSEMGPVRATDDEVWRMVAFVRSISTVNVTERAAGDAKAGKIVYDKKGACASCHRIGNNGGSLGPELTDIGRRRGVSFLMESLVKPEADLPINFRGLRIVTASGQTVSGIRLNEDDHSIQIRDTGDNLRSFIKSNIKEIRRDSPSLMPSYATSLNKKELEDVVAYLNSLRGETR
jgi:putative heme-binding domain-containing protein